MREFFQVGLASGTKAAFDYRVIRPDGSVRWLEALAQAQRDGSGKLLSIVGTDRDVTEAREAEQALREKSLQLEEANRRLHEIDRFKTDLVNAASHDLRTPLTLIMGCTELLEDEAYGPLNEAQRHDLSQIAYATERLSGLVDDLLDFARVQAGTFMLDRGPLDLASTIEGELALFALKIQERALDVRVQLVDPLPPIEADAQRIGRAIMNLLANAIKFTPDGSITVRAEAVEGAVKINVRDTGVGIAPEHVARLFERFYQAGKESRVAEGLGLGLSIVASVAEAHGGTVGVESRLGEGSSFWFTLPTRGVHPR